jgi:hypothetical protein
MATFHEIAVSPAPFKADVDMSSTVNTAGCALYRLVTNASTANNVKPSIGASNPTPLGVLQNSPSAGQEAEVRVIGFSLVTGRCSTCNLTPGRYVVAASDGCVEASNAAGCPVCGKWMGPSYSTAGGSIYGEMLLFGITACPATTN